MPFRKVDRAVCEGEPDGFVTCVVDAKDRILGVHAIGAHAGELLAEWVLAMEHEISLEKVGSAIHAYPTFTRANRRLADERFFGPRHFGLAHPFIRQLHTSRSKRVGFFSWRTDAQRGFSGRTRCLSSPASI